MSEILKLEKRRKFIVKKIFFYILGSVFLLFFILNFLFKSYLNLKSELNFTGENTPLFYLFLAIFLLITTSYYKFSLSIFNEDIKEFRSSYKDLILKPFIKTLDLKYSKYGHVHALHLIASEFFHNNFDTQEGNDFIKGRIGETSFSFSDIVLSDMDYSLFKDIMFGFHFSMTKRRKIMGLFFVADFNKNINSNTKIYTKSIANFPSSYYKKIKMDNANFNNMFDVFTDNVINANYILTPKFIENITNLQKFVKRDFKMSFNRDRIYIFCNQGKDSFEPSLLKPVYDRESIKAIKNEILSVIAIIKDLELNNRIWLKNSAIKDGNF